MNKKRNFSKLLLLLVASGNLFLAEAKIHHFIFDDMDDNNIDNLFDFSFFDKIQSNFAQSMPAQDKEVAAAQQALQNIKPEITQDENTVTVKFNLANADKKAVTVEVKELDKGNNIIEGIIPADKDGRVQFYVSSDRLTIVRNIEIKKEIKNDKQKQNSIAQFKSTSSESFGLPAAVVISKDIKAVTKDNALYITLQKKKTPTTKVAVSHL